MRRSRSGSASGNAARRGSAYILVLVTTAIVTMIALTIATTWRSRLLATRISHDRARARLHAAAALDLGLHATRVESTWRADKGDTWLADVPVRNGLISLYAEDPGDGDLVDDEMDPVRLRAVGRSGIAREVIEATLEALPQPLSSLESGLHAGLGLTLSNATVVSDEVLRTNGSVTATSSSVSPGVESTGLMTTLGYSGTRKTGVAVRPLPAASVVADYAATATLISAAQLPTSGGYLILENVLLSPAHNPFGTPNAQGRYVVDAGGLSIRIRNVRLYGTLILRNAPVDSVIEASVTFDPVEATAPVLLVQGSIRLAFSDAPLQEAGIGSLNPAGAPFGGASDNDQVDEFPSRIAGLVFVSGDATFSNNPTVEGPVLVGGLATIGSRLTLRNDGAWLSDPPEGFRGPPLMRIASGSVVRAVD